MKRLIINPDGWPCKFGELRPGFFTFNDGLFLKSEYGTDAYCDSGEMFWGGVSNPTDRNDLRVQPVVAEWEEYEE